MNASNRPETKRASCSTCRWQAWQDELIRALPPDAAARRVGRSLPEVIERIRHLSKFRDVAVACY